MRAKWEALHAGLVRSIRSLQSAQALDNVRQRRAELSSFDEPSAVVGFLTGRGGEPDQKDRLIASLVTMVQERDEAELGAALLWLGLWPGLDAIYRRRLRHFLSAPDELVSELGAAFTEQIAALDLSAVNRVAATLVRSSERRLLEGRVRAWKLLARLELRGTDVIPPDAQSEARPDSALGMHAGSGSEAEFGRLLHWLEPLVGEDAELVLDVLVLGDTKRAAGARLGLPSQATRKRFRRALARIRKHLVTSLSRPSPQPRV